MPEFKDAHFMSAKEKELVLKQWKNFLKKLVNNYNETFEDSRGYKVPVPLGAFTSRIYEHLHLHCSYICHYNRHGFYQTYFANPEDTIKFFSQFDDKHDHRSVELGMDHWICGKEYEDINQAMCDAFMEVKDQMFVDLASKAKEDDIASAKALLAKHGMEMKEVIV